MTKLEFIKLVNDTRKANKDKWFSIVEVVNDKGVSIKCFNTWVQRISIMGDYDSNCMNQSVKQFNEFLTLALSEV